MTWSILAIDPATGQIGIAAASSAPGVGDKIPYIRSKVGAVAAQAAVNQDYGTAALDLMSEGYRRTLSRQRLPRAPRGAVSAKSLSIVNLRINSNPNPPGELRRLYSRRNQSMSPVGAFNIPTQEDREREQRIRSMLGWQSTAIPPLSTPTDIGSGIQAVANALMYRKAQQQAQFPTAPAGGSVSPFQGVKNMFGLGGGLY